jgi:hypothetical protein
MIEQDTAVKPEPMKLGDQEAFDRFTISALKIIHDKKITTGLIEQIKNTEDTVSAIGDVAMSITDRIVSGARGKAKLSPVAIINGINVVVGELINICEAAGANKLSQEQRYQSFSWALSGYFQSAINSGDITEQDLKSIQRKMVELSEKEKQGQQTQQQPQPEQPPAPQNSQQIPQQSAGILSQGGI